MPPVWLRGTPRGTRTKRFVLEMWAQLLEERKSIVQNLKARTD
ncbi:MAG: hypothetical protein QOH11_1532 [Solirubrobacteraceae bacterium]|nr:hypothetical protein [Solirubrobacteraceae bacterium]